VEKIKKLWRNEYFKTAISILLVILLFLIFWYGSIAYFNTESPYLVVSSGSMRPTLEVGDLIIVKRIDPSQLNYGFSDGDIIVFKNPNDPKELIVHRLVSVTLKNGIYEFKTHGDANPPKTMEEFNVTFYIGKVIARVQYVGHISLFTHTAEGSYFFIFVIICVIVIFIFLPSDEKTKEQNSNEKQEEKEFLSKVLNFNFIVFLVLNILILGFLIFSLWGAFSFWQPGAEEGFQHVKIRGMYADLQYHKNSVNVKNALLYQGLFTYKIDCVMVDGSIRIGVPTFSWAQFSILLLVLVNVWVITKFLLSKRRLSYKAEQ